MGYLFVRFLQQPPSHQLTGVQTEIVAEPFHRMFALDNIALQFPFAEVERVPVSKKLNKLSKQVRADIEQVNMERPLRRCFPSRAPPDLGCRVPTWPS